MYKDKNLRLSIFDGIFASSMTGFTQEYFPAFILLLGATAKEVGMLSALPNLFASLAQLKSPDLTEKLKSRKKMINIFVLLQALMLLPLAFIAFYQGAKPLVFIGFVIMFTCCGALATPAWGSLMSDLVSKEKRGEYFGWRNRVLGFVIVGMSFAAGLILHFAKNRNVFYGFAFLFAAAALFRLISWFFLGKMTEPALEYKPEHYFSLANFLARVKESNFAKFVLFVAGMSFSVNLASPFFAVLMLKELHFNYLLYSVINITSTLMIYLTISRWGRHADIMGNLKVIKLTSVLIGIIPLLWIINRHPAFLILAQIFSGFVWAGFNLCSTNFIYDAVTPEKRTRCIAYFNAFNGAALCAGALLGGFLLQMLPPLLGLNILTLFVISAVMRLIISLLVPSRLKEVRSVEKVASNDLFFSVIGIKPLLGVDRRTIRY